MWLHPTQYIFKKIEKNHLLYKINDSCPAGHFSLKKYRSLFKSLLLQISRAFSNISSVLPQILTNFVSCWGSFEIFESFFTKSTVLTVQHSLLFYGFSFFNYLPTPRSGSVCYSTSMSLRAAGQLQKGML